ncbi:MAG: DnaJ C-terminal domain-containing protein, partial [Myxococcota bacterium]
GAEKTRSAPKDSPFQQSDVRARAGRERTARPPMPQPGNDVHIDLDVPAHVARDGGTVDAVYRRMQRSDSWRPGAPDAGILQIRDITVVRLLPGTGHGEVLHEKGQGDAGAYGGPYGDLIVRVRVVGATQQDGSAGRDHGTESTGSTTEKPNAHDGVIPELSVDVDMVIAALGGQVEVLTPQGRVRLTVPPGTSSDKKLRLRGKGPSNTEGAPLDLTVRLRVVVPKDISDESAALLRQFAMSRFKTESSSGDA